MKSKMFFAGSGGQGTLAIGQMIAKAAMDEGKEVTWLPSYGPEMRGGTANCSVIVSDEPIGAPIVLQPDVLIAMNVPSLDKYENEVVPGGTIYVDSSLIGRRVERTDITVRYIPATSLAAEKGLDGLANMIIMGSLLKNEKADHEESVEKALGKCISARHADMLKFNREALRIGGELQ